MRILSLCCCSHVVGSRSIDGEGFLAAAALMRSSVSWSQPPSIRRARGPTRNLTMASLPPPVLTILTQAWEAFDGDHSQHDSVTPGFRPIARSEWNGSSTTAVCRCVAHTSQSCAGAAAKLQEGCTHSHPTADSTNTHGPERGTRPNRSSRAPRAASRGRQHHA
jgi:hypothetical protein